MRTTFYCCLLSASLFAGACADEGGVTAPSSTAGPHALPVDDGKSDNYISTNAREFLLTGYAHAELSSDFESLEGDARAEALQKAAERRLPVVIRAIKSHITKTLEPFNDGETGEDAKWFIYVRRDAGTFNDVSVVTGEAAEGEEAPAPRARFAFELELAGSNFLMSKVAPEASARRTFEVVVKDWSESEGETVTVEIAGTESRDAFPKYDELFADGVLDVAVHFGGDYNADRHDIETAKWLVETLLEDGFAHETVTDFDTLKIDSGPFTRSLRVEGRDLEVQVYVVHSDMVEPAEESKLSDAMKESLKSRDIVIYSGHAGENAGFILDYQPRHEIKASEFASLEMADKYQIFVLDGCRTYRTYVEDLLANPHKTYDNLDIMTTINTTPFSVGYQVLWEFVFWLTLTDDQGNHFPLSWKAILGGVNTESFEDVHYGVHGIDQDPQLNPHASEGIACQPCETDADCGAGGNFCLGYGGGAACGVACTTDTACPDGFRCGRITEDPDLFYLPKQCIKRDYVCE